MYKTLDVEYLPEGFPNNIDWNENNETSRSYIRNRPCYEKEIEYKTIFQNTITENYYYEDSGLCFIGHQYRIICNDEMIDATPIAEPSEDGYPSYIILTPSIRIRTYNLGGEGWTTTLTTQGDFTAPYEITIQEIIPAELKQLDDKFIPDTIARTSEVVTSINGQTGDVSLLLDDFVDRDALKEYVKGEPITTYEWEEIGSNIHHEDEHITLTKPINLDKFNIKLVSSAGEEDLIPWSEKNYIISRKPDGSYILLYTGGVKHNSSVYELRISGMIDGSGETYVSYVEMVTPDATLSIYIENEIISYQTVPEASIPDSIARVRDINYPVTSVNGQTGDVVISKSWNDLRDKPFGEDYKLLFSHTPENMNHYHGNEVFQSGIDYCVVWKGLEYIGRTVDRNGHDTYTSQSSELFLYDKSGKYVTGNLWCFYDDGICKVMCNNYLKGSETDSLYVYDPTCVEVRTLDDTFISENIARKVDLTWSSLGERQTVLIPRGKNAYVTGCPAPTPGVKYTYTVYHDDGGSWSFTNTW
jgi:hypothetical protein